ncbi:MAG: hypothetical protein P9L94_00280 [Candidatus Hinthialibacter antarcticus]|nr:hypothetical protein [Candidatus Hinthialibacter antarcticus]
MRLRTQNLLFLLPVFLVTIIVMGGFKYYTERNVLLSGYETKANAFAISISEFLTPNALQELHEISAADDVISGDLELAFARILDDGLALRLSVHDSQSFEAIYAWGQEPTIDSVAYLNEHNDWFHQTVRSEHENESENYDSLFFYPNQGEPDQPLILIASAPVNNGLDELAAVVMVEMDVSGISELSFSILRDLLWICVIVLLIGVLAAFTLSFIISHSIRELTYAIQDVQSGDLHEIKLTSSIREINGLENTYNTMVEVLKEERERDQDELMSIESQRVQKDLEKVYQHVIWPEIKIQHNALSGVGVIQDISKGEFMDLVEVEDGVCAIVGRVSEKEFTAIVSASSVVPFWRSQLQSGPVEDAVKCIGEIFELDWFECVWVQSSEGGVIKTWNKPPGVSEVEPGQRPKQAGSSVVLHAESGESAKDIERFVRRLGYLDPTALHEHLNNALQNPPVGPIVIIKT